MLFLESVVPTDHGVHPEQFGCLQQAVGCVVLLSTRLLVLRPSQLLALTSTVVLDLTLATALTPDLVTFAAERHHLLALELVDVVIMRTHRLVLV